MLKARIPAHALVLLLVLASATPAFARPSDDEMRRREATAAKKAEAAAKLNALRASDRDLEAAVRALDANVVVQNTTTADARQAVSAAESALGSAEAELARTEQELGDLRAQASAIAVRAYVHPGNDSLLEIVGARDLTEASRRQALMSYVVTNDRDVLEELRAVRQDQQAQQENLTDLRDQAAERRAAAEERLSKLRQAQSEQARLQSSLDERIRQYTAEVDALSREEANLAALIRTREAELRAAPRPPSAGKPAPAGGGGGDSGRVSGSGLIWPVGGPVTSGFGMRWGRMHTGIDIAAGYGTPVKAAKGGTVLSAGSMGGYGNLVIIDHGGGLSTLYAHLSKFGVGDGASVSQGQVVGNIGTSGNSTGAHLHFETRSGGSPQNPMNYL